MTDQLSDIEISGRAEKNHIDQIAQSLEIDANELEHYGRYKAKISPRARDRLANHHDGHLILVSAISPTPAGEGKTTTTIGLGDALNQLGKKPVICLREPSLGPCFGMKGGAAGGGYAQVVPMEDINLHFTGDFHAIGLAHNLVSAAIDNHLYHGNDLQIDPRKVTWKRVMDMNDRALRHITVGLGGTAHSIPRESGFDITAASEVMAIFCLSYTLHELKARMGTILVASTYDNKPVTVADLKVHGSMVVLLKDAFNPNLVQTLEHTPALVHGGPFANIAHGCNSVSATKMALKLGDYTITEAGFGADLGAEKFFNIKCRQHNLKPKVVVLVATIRALKYHGGIDKQDLQQANTWAVEKGLVNLHKHIENIGNFNVPVVVALNHFSADTSEEIAIVEQFCQVLNVPMALATHWRDGGKGAIELAKKVVECAQNPQSEFKVLYADNMTLWEKTRTIAQKIYGANDILADQKLRDKFAQLEQDGYGHVPVCMAKTQYSFSTDPNLRGRPTDFDVPLRDIKLSAGAGFVVVLTGDIMTMPGLPKVPAAENIDIDEQGEVVGLF